MLNRRGLLFGLGASLVAAPAIVRAGSLMPVRALTPSSLAASGELTVEKIIEFKQWAFRAWIRQGHLRQAKIARWRDFDFAMDVQLGQRSCVACQPDSDFQHGCFHDVEQIKNLLKVT